MVERHDGSRESAPLRVAAKRRESRVAAKRVRCTAHRASVDVVRDTSGGGNVADWCVGVDSLIVIDAVMEAPGLTAGDIVRVNYRREPERLAAMRMVNSHTMDVAAGLRLAERLGLLPERVTIIGIVGQRFEQGAPMSSAVRRGVVRAVRMVRSVIGDETEALRCASRLSRVEGGSCRA
jgi:hydrogenase maturation protease